MVNFKAKSNPFLSTIRTASSQTQSKTPSNSSVLSSEMIKPETSNTSATCISSLTPSNPASKPSSNDRENPPLILKMRGPAVRKVLRQIRRENQPYDHRKARNRFSAKLSRERKAEHIRHLEQSLSEANERLLRMGNALVELQKINMENAERITKLENDLAQTWVACVD